jgi:aspartokinase/homoserine dehydrogenase 1
LVQCSPKGEGPATVRRRKPNARRLDAETRKATVGLVELEPSHLFANISLTDNVVSFTTSRYDRNPLVVRGPGAGPAVTAGGVFADLLRVCAYLGAHL